MTVIALANPTIYTNNVGNATDGELLRADLNTIISEVNAKDTRLDNLESNTMSLGGVKTFTSLPLLPASMPTTVNQAVRKLYADQAATRRISGKPPTYVGANSISVPTMSAFDSTNTYWMTTSGATTVALNTAAGINSIDTGSEASATWYYLYMVGKSTDYTASGFVLSTVNENVSGSITLPVTYDIKRQLPFAVRNNGSSNILEFCVGAGWPTRPEIFYVLQHGDSNSAGATQVLSAGAATSPTDVDCSAFIPPLSQLAIVKMQCLDTGGSLDARVLQKGGNHEYTFRTSAASALINAVFPIKTDSAQALQYDFNGGTPSTGMYLWIPGYVITEI